jgi:hypothetical protein
MERSPERNGVLKICEELGIGFVPWGPVGMVPRRPCLIFPFVCSPLLPLSVSGFFPKRSKRLGGDPQPIRYGASFSPPPVLSCFCFRVCREKKGCQCGCRTNGQFCVACAQACCGSGLAKGVIFSRVHAGEISGAWRLVISEANPIVDFLLFTARPFSADARDSGHLAHQPA